MSGKTILIVDNDADYVAEQKRLLEAAGYRVETAEGRIEAEKKMPSVKADLVVMELMLEDLDGGFALAYHLKKASPKLPIIIASSVKSDTGVDFDAVTDEERSWVKADTFLAKPFRFEQLKQEVAKLLGH